ncbi:hypothetical protein, conserved [Eimeria necatrix]|uniref:Uncharacterized protein n=1 Tax=Eimeria necatrix TaxID=51315 RepID=U6MMB9_9EIME|nr:hypothetical protein, conserved [Eimeria necatrix]CDJ64218.1 hypothetical protein, conserved [Eimeria necatrix]
MGSTHSHELATAPLGHNQNRRKQCKSVALPSLERSQGDQGLPECPVSTARPGKLKLNGLAAGDSTTCCTTTCGSSLSGFGASPQTRSTGLSGGSSAVTITLSCESCLERSESAQAVSSIASQSPRASTQKDYLDVLEESAKKSTARGGRWSRRTPRVQGLLKTLRRGAVRCRSQPAPSRSQEGSREYINNELGAETVPATSAAALHAFILKEEDEHRRRRHSNMLDLFSAASVANIEHEASRKVKAFEEESSGATLDGTQNAGADRSASCHGEGRSASSPSGNAVQAGETQQSQLPRRVALRRVAGRRALELPQCNSGAPSSWICDAPPDGRWEIERGVWNRQGVHLNHLRVADDRFKALAATRLLSPPSLKGQSQGIYKTSGMSVSQPITQHRGVPIAPLAGRLRENQQLLLQSGYQVVPVTNRGVAAATTIELVKSRHANEERRRQRHRHIASPELSPKIPSPVGPQNSSIEEQRRRDHNRVDAQTSARELQGTHGRTLVETQEQPVRCNRQTLLASGNEQPLDTGEPHGLKTIGGGGDAQASRCALSVPTPPFVSHAQQEKQDGTNFLQPSYCAASVKGPQKCHDSGCPPANPQVTPSASRAQQRNAFVANPRTHTQESASWSTEGHHSEQQHCTG